MGMVASTSIWVGVSIDRNDSDELSLSSLLPEELLKELDDVGEIKVEDLTFVEFHRFDQGVGFGVLLFERDYYAGVQEIDLGDLHLKGQRLLAQVTQVFRSWGSAIPPRILIDMDYS